MGVYGYGTAGLDIPEGYLQVTVETDTGPRAMEILFPANPGSIYHMTKTQDQLFFLYYNKNDGVRITDLHQGIVWGTQTPQTVLDERLINRFDYDGDYGTVLNRFLMQGVLGYPLTVHGTGGQTRGFIHIRDTVRCVELAIANPPKKGDRVHIFNQMTETHRLIDLAKMVSEMTGTPFQLMPNPRVEAAENELRVSHTRFLKLGFKPTKLQDSLLTEVQDIARKYLHRCDKTRIPCTSLWRHGEAQAAAPQPEAVSLKDGALAMGRYPSPQPSPAQARLGALASLECPHPQADADGRGSRSQPSLGRPLSHWERAGVRGNARRVEHRLSACSSPAFYRSGLKRVQQQIFGDREGVGPRFRRPGQVAAMRQPALHGDEPHIGRGVLRACRAGRQAPERTR